MNRWLRSVCIASLFLYACATRGHGSLAAGSALEGVELEDFEQMFDESACICQALLLDRGRDLIPADVAGRGDPELLRFVRAAAERPGYCAALSPRPVTPLSDLGANGCYPVGPDGTNDFGTNVSDGARARLADGFCTADFNRCLSLELDARASSLASAPRSRVVRDSLMAESRVRLQSSMLELSNALGRYADGCGVDEWARSRTPRGPRMNRHDECNDRLEGSDYGAHAINRLAEGTLRLGELLEREAQAAALTADALSPGMAETPQAYVEAFWGRDGARMAAAQGLMGALGADVPYRHADGTSPYLADLYTVGGLYADRVARDERVAVAMRLLIAHQIPIPMISYVGYRVPVPAFEEDPSAFYNLLDHRVAYAAHTSPYDLGRLTDAEWAMDPVPLPTAPPEIASRAAMTASEFNAYAGRPLDLNDSPLRHYYGVEPEHVREALAMVRNLLDTTGLEYRPTDQVHFGVFSFPAIQPVLTQPRDPRYLAAALLNVGEVSADVYGDPLAVMPEHGAPSGQIYSYDPVLARELGGALALHVVRVQLGRIAANSRGRSWLREGETTLPEARALASSYLGDVWVEYKQHQDYLCPPSPFGDVCPGNPLCPPFTAAGYLCPDGAAPTAPLLVGTGHVDLYFDPARTEFARDADGDGVLEGSVVVVRRRDDVYCLVHGHRPDGGDEGCAGVSPVQLTELRPTTYVHASRPPAVARIGFEQRRFELPNPSSYGLPSADGSLTSDAFLLFRSGARSAPEEGAVYRFIDVIQPRRQASVHPLGGRFLEMFADAFATDPNNPGRPAVAALGLSYDLVPPLEHELISDGDGFEDSYRTYIRNATDAAGSASTQLRTARDLELSERLDARADAALLAEAEVAEAEVISEACGTPGGCDIARRDVVTLGAILVDGEPLVTEPHPEEIPGFSRVQPDGQIRLQLDLGDSVPTRSLTCAEHLAGFNSRFDLRGTSKHDWDQYTEAYLSAGLGCARYFVQLAAYHTALHDVPEEVLNELEAGGAGEFRSASGEARDALIAMFGDIVEMRESLRAFESNYIAGIAQIQSGARQIDVLVPSDEEAFLCYLGQGLAIAGAAIAAAVTIVATFGTGTAAVVVAIVAVVVASAAGGVALGAAECEGDTRPARAQAETTFADAVIALDNLRGASDRLRRAAGAVARGDAGLDRLARRVEIAQQRRQIRAQVAMSNAVSDLPEWHVLQGYRVRRARRALSRAQQYAYIARRSVEYRFGLDMAVMNRSEPFVDPPAAWVNDLFVLDTATSADTDPTGIDHVNTSGEAIADWVQQLGDFVRGYPFTRRFRDATDAQVLRVENLGLDARTEPDGAFLYQRMMFKCFDADPLLLAGEPLPTTPGLPWPRGAPCEGLGGVDYAELPFVIPARLDGYVGRRLASGSYNYRHERVAFNVVGSAVVDCRRAERPWECYGDGNLEFSLRQSGLVFVENHEREVHSFLAEPGVILEGRALAAERVLTNPLTAADRGLISPFERRELWGRPLMGSYVLRIHGRPEINWRYIEGVQMLLDYRYWTRQE